MKTFIKYSYFIQFFLFGEIVPLLFIRNVVVVDAHGGINYYELVPLAFVFALVFSKLRFLNMLVIFAGSVIQLATVQLFGYTKNIPPRLMIDTLIVGYLLIIVGLWFIKRDTIATDTLDDSENDEETDVVISTD